MSADAQNSIEDPFEWVDWDVLVRRHPEQDPVTDAPHTADLVHLLEVGDSVVWGERAHALDIVDRRRGAEGRAPDHGEHDRVFRLEGPQGGIYEMLMLWFWGDGDIPTPDPSDAPDRDVVSLWPQVHRKQQGKYHDGKHPDVMAAVAPIHIGVPEDPGEVGRLVHTVTTTDHHYAAQVVGFEYGEFVVTYDDAAPISEGRYTVDPDSVIMWREVAE